MLALEDHGLLLFAASDGVHGMEPWVTDGTEAGVHGREPWSLALEPLPVTPEEPKTGCGDCQSVGAPGTLAPWGVMVLAARGSRRRRP